MTVLGPRVAQIDNIKVRKGQWYNASNSENVKAVVGILEDEKTTPETARKRRRTDQGA